MSTPEHPTWSNHISSLFTTPYWVEPAEKRKSVSEDWIAAMKSCDVDLSSYASVRDYAIVVYRHLTSPETLAAFDRNESWPRQASETFRLWISEGMRESDNAPIGFSSKLEIITAPSAASDLVSTRRDILSLTEGDLNVFRDKITNAINGPNWDAYCSAFNKYEPVTGAFLPWHRAHLLAFETLIGFPIPFWNFFAADSTDSSSDASGLPTAFLDETYTGQNGEVLSNPLRFAPVPRSDLENLPKIPIRDPLLTIGTADARALKTGEAAAYLARINGVLTLPEPPARPALDWLLELAYGAVRTWVGGDMGLTLRAAYDPPYWPFMANVDRISSQLMEAYTLNTTEVLKPFAWDGDTGNLIIVEDGGPDTKYATIGDMLRMQASYSDPPAFPDFAGVSQ